MTKLRNGCSGDALLRVELTHQAVCYLPCGLQSWQASEYFGRQKIAHLFPRHLLSRPSPMCENRGERLCDKKTRASGISFCPGLLDSDLLLNVQRLNYFFLPAFFLLGAFFVAGFEAGFFAGFFEGMFNLPNNICEESTPTAFVRSLSWHEFRHICPMGKDKSTTFFISAAVFLWTLFVA